jgi:membrane protease YdiL (CAAX protease family)
MLTAEERYLNLLERQPEVVQRTPQKIFLISAVIFGLAHIKGMPNGFIGVILAGLLGYILSKSVHETNGIFWAWFIHFLQDVIIIGSLFLIESS